jgi:hypothetical protein
VPLGGSSASVNGSSAFHFEMDYDHVKCAESGRGTCVLIHPFLTPFGNDVSMRVHRNRVKHFHEPGDSNELTLST